MRNRSGSVDTEEEAAALTLPQLETLIVRARYGYETGGSSEGRSAFFNRLVELASLRETHYGILARKRRL